MSETMTPKENFNFLNAYLKEVSPLIRQNKGFIDKFIGDAIMALYPEDATHAIRSAIEMHQAVNNFNATVRIPNNQIPMRIGIGLHKGKLIMGTVGEEKRMDSTVISDAVNLSSRLESLTKVFGVKIIIIRKNSRRISHILMSIFKSRYLGRVQVKGKQQAINIVEIYEGDHPVVIEFKERTKNRFTEGCKFI